MSLKAQIEVQCPAGCEPFEGEVWSVLHAEQDPAAKDKLLAGELNLLMCPSCNRYFIHEQPLVYHDQPRELLAFIFPEYFKEEEERWRTKMREDYAELRRTAGTAAIDYEPVIYFGLESFRTYLEQEANLDDEVEIMRHLARSLKLGLYPVRPSYARSRNIPPLLPCEEAQGGDARLQLVQGLQKLLKENEFLASYQRCLSQLQTGQDAELPPRVKRA